MILQLYSVLCTLYNVQLYTHNTLCIVYSVHRVQLPTVTCVSILASKLKPIHHNTTWIHSYYNLLSRRVVRQIDVPQIDVRQIDVRQIQQRVVQWNNNNTTTNNNNNDNRTVYDYHREVYGVRRTLYDVQCTYIIQCTA